MLGRKLFLLFIATLLIHLGEGACSAQTLNIFGNAVPMFPNSLPPAVTVGVKFWSSQPGTISGIRFYRAVQSPQGYQVKLYSAAGSLLGSATIAKESSPLPGWQKANFASPIPILANTTYIATYYCLVGAGATDPSSLTNGVRNGPLTAPASGTVGGNGVWNFQNAFPSYSGQGGNYYVDVLFTPTVLTPTLSLSFNPPNPSISSTAPLGSTVATIIASWSDGSPFTGTLSFGPPYSNGQGRFAISGNNKLIINSSGPGVSHDGNTTQHVTIVATQ